MGAPYPRVNTVWNSSLNQQNFQPTVQVPYNHLGQPTGYTQIQQHVQPMLHFIPQLYLPSSIQQLGLSTPRTLVQFVASTFVQQPSTPIPRVSQVPIATAPQVMTSTISQPITQVIVHQPGPTVHSTVQTSAGQPGTTIIAIIQPYTGQFVYQSYQGKFQYGPIGKNPVYQSQPYPSYTYQIPSHLQFGTTNPGYPGGIPIPTAQPIPSYPGCPPPGTGIVPQGYLFSQQDPNRQLPFIATLDFPYLFRLTNDLIY